MPIQCEHSIEVNASPEVTFRLFDDLPQTPKWLAPCTALEKLSAGPNTVSDKLRYSYKQGRQSGTMDGEIIARTPNEKLVCRYFDPMFEVVVDLRVSPSVGGSRLTHIITITPRTFWSKLLSPLIRLGLKKQTQQAMNSLKELLEKK